LSTVNLEEADPDLDALAVLASLYDGEDIMGGQ